MLIWEQNNHHQIIIKWVQASCHSHSHLHQVFHLNVFFVFGDAQWIGHILKRLHLLDDARRKRGMDGMMYAVQPIDVIDMMRRYEVAVIRETN